MNNINMNDVADKLISEIMECVKTSPWYGDDYKAVMPELLKRFLPQTNSALESVTPENIKAIAKTITKDVFHNLETVAETRLTLTVIKYGMADAIEELNAKYPSKGEPKPLPPVVKSAIDISGGDMIPKDKFIRIIMEGAIQSEYDDIEHFRANMTYLLSEL